MPNHVKNKLYAQPEILDSLKGEEGEVDFCTVIPYPDGLFMGSDPHGGINCLSEDCAQQAFNEPLSDHPLLASLQASNRAKWSAADMNDEAFEDFIAMLRSKRGTGFYHVLDFSISECGTKWNAYSVSRQKDHVEFQTAWSAPKPLFVALSAKFPEWGLKVEYADEDRGNNCGTLILTGGEVKSDIPGDIAFAHDLWGDSEEIRKEYAEEA